jgi:copper(I)-binding protein
MKTTTLTVALMSLLATAASGQDVTRGDLAIAHPYALATPPGARTGGAYLQRIDNHGKTTDTLVGATTPVADRVEIHTMRMDGDVMRMQAAQTLAVEPGHPVTMRPGGGYHLMMVGLHAPLVVGHDIPMTLAFERAGKVDVVLHVEERGAAMAR